MDPHASASASHPPAPTDPRSLFLEFLRGTEYPDREDLYALFTTTPDVHATIALHADSFRPILAYMDTYLLKHCVSLHSLPGDWVPCDLLRHIHRKDRPFSQRLARFEQVAEAAGLYVTVGEDHRSYRMVKKQKLGSGFLSHFATFIFLVSEESAEEEVVLPHMQVGGLIKDSKEISAQPVDPASEEEHLRAQYPKGLAGVLEEAGGQSSRAAVPESQPLDEAIPEVEITRLSGVIVDGEEFVYLHDLEKAGQLRMDECLSMICIKAEFPFDTKSTHLDDILQPLGDSVMDTVRLVNEEFERAEQKDVPEADYQATQAGLVARRTPLPEGPMDPADVYLVLDESKSSISLESSADQDLQDQRQEDVLDMDAWATRTGGRRQAFGPQAALAHYLGKLPNEAVVIVHREYSPNGPFNVFALKALSKVLCLSTVAQTNNVIVLVKKSLATSVFSCGFLGKVLAHIGINQAIGETDPGKITESLLTGEVPQKKARKKIIVKKLLKSGKPPSL